MEKDFDFVNNGYKCESVIERGYTIYDEWNQKKLKSKQVVRFVENATDLEYTGSTKKSYYEALSCLFALDMRINEKYNSFWRRVFLYFSWRREINTLNRFKKILHIADGTDIRDAIVIAIEKLAEKLEDERNEDGDDDTHSGKRNEKAEEEAATEENGIEDSPEEKNEAEELADKEEKEKDSEQIEEEPIENAQQEEAKEDISEKEETAEIQQEEAEVTATDEKEALVQKKDGNLKAENNVSDYKSESITDKTDKIDKKEEDKAYNDAVDSPPLYEKNVSDRTAEKNSFIDEMIIDNMVKGDKDAMGYTSVEGLKQNKEADLPQNTVVSQNEENKSTEKDAHLYDKTLANGKGETQQLGKTESTHQTEKTSEIKTEQPKEEIQKNYNVNSNKQESKPLSEMLKSDNLNVDLDNSIANALNDYMSLESKMALIRMQEDMFREHISITLEELGMDTSDVLRVSEPVEFQATETELNKK